MADDGYLIGFEDSSGNFVEVGRFNNLSGNTSDPVFIEHTGSGTRIELDGSGFDMNGNDITGAGSVSIDELNRDQVGTKIYDSNRTTYNENTPKIIPFDSVAFDDDPNGEADIANNQITVNESGTYKIEFGFACRSDVEAGSKVILRPQVNNGSIFAGNIQISQADFLNTTLGWERKLSAGDTVKMELEYRNAGGSQSFSGNDGEYQMFLLVREDG